jgi:hypothetical protein
MRPVARHTELQEPQRASTRIFAYGGDSRNNLSKQLLAAREYDCDYGAYDDDNAQNRREARENRGSLAGPELSATLHIQTCNDQQQTQDRRADYG